MPKKEADNPETPQSLAMEEVGKAFRACLKAIDRDDEHRKVKVAALEFSAAGMLQQVGFQWEEARRIVLLWRR